jgi:site-specific recombinase XerD
MGKLLKQFNIYLKSIGYKGRTLSIKLLNVKRFILWVELKGLTLNKVNYQEANDYLESAKQATSISTQKKNVKAISDFYLFLMDNKKAKSNPFGNIYIRKEHRKIPSNLLSQKQIDKIYASYTSEKLYTESRNKCMLSLICYQGLLTQDIENLKLSDVDLVKGNICIATTPHQNGRILKLEAFQVLLFEKYIKEYRYVFLRNRKGEMKDRLFLSTLKSPSLVNTFAKLLEKLKELNPDLISFRQIKQSLMTLWSERENIKEVQYKSGHKYVSSTQRFNLQHLQELRTRLIQFHPLAR